MADALSQKSFLLVYIGTYDGGENIKIKFGSAINIKIMKLKKSLTAKRRQL